MKLTRTELYSIIEKCIDDPPEYYFNHNFSAGTKRVLTKGKVVNFILDSDLFKKKLEEEITYFLEHGKFNLREIVNYLLWNKNFLKTFPNYDILMKSLKEASNQNFIESRDGISERIAIGYIPTLKKLGYTVDKVAPKK